MGVRATIDYIGRRFGLQHLGLIRLLLRGRRSTWSSSGSFCVAGAALGALLSRFAWQAQHFCVAGAALGAIQGGESLNKELDFR